MISIQSINAEQTIKIRHRVLWPEKSPQAMQLDGDKDAVHFGGFSDQALVCVGSFFIDGTRVRLRKFATLPEYQGKGIGTKLLATAINELKKRGCTRLWCDARESALPFYKRLGFSHYGERFYKGDVAYFKTALDLTQPTGETIN